MAKRLNKSQRDRLSAYEAFFRLIEEKYRVTRDEIISVVEEYGLVKGQIDTYFLVRRHLAKARGGM